MRDVISQYKAAKAKFDIIVDNVARARHPNFDAMWSNEEHGHTTACNYTKETIRKSIQQELLQS